MIESIKSEIEGVKNIFNTAGKNLNYFGKTVLFLFLLAYFVIFFFIFFILLLVFKIINFLFFKK